MGRWLKTVFFAVLIKPLVLLIIGVNIRHRSRLPQRGPAIIIANHNSHLDTLVLLSLFPLQDLARIRPVAAGDYFMRNRVLAWFSTQMIGIIPIQRKAQKGLRNPLQPVSQALERNEIVIIFPEGSRGKPEKMQEMKQGVAHLALKHPNVPVIPIFIHGLGKALPKGEGLLVPFICDLFIGKPIPVADNIADMMESIRNHFAEMVKQFPIDLEDL